MSGRLAVGGPLGQRAVGCLCLGAWTHSLLPGNGALCRAGQELCRNVRAVHEQHSPRLSSACLSSSRSLDLGLLKEELPSTAPTASTATQDNGGGKTSSPSARLCSCQGTIASPKKGPQRARSFTSVIDRACNMTQFCSTASSNNTANSSSTRAAARKGWWALCNGRPNLWRTF